MKKLLLVIFILSLVGCNDNSSEVIIPTKPDNVPKTAFWQGGIDGGAWYECKKTNTNFQYHCIVYNDFTGIITIEDDFELHILTKDNREIPMDKYIQMSELTSDEVDFFDGYHLHLEGTLALKPIKGLFSD